MRFIDGLRHERESPTAAYHQFLLKAAKFPGDVHAFFEGQDDVSFYTNFLHRFTSNSKGIHPYRCGNKRGVYEAHSKVHQVRRQQRVLFFVDKDLSDILNEEWEGAQDIFVTDYYSIENYLVYMRSNRSTIRRESGVCPPDGFSHRPIVISDKGKDLVA